MIEGTRNDERAERALLKRERDPPSRNTENSLGNEFPVDAALAAIDVEDHALAVGEVFEVRRPEHAHRHYSARRHGSSPCAARRPGPGPVPGGRADGPDRPPCAARNGPIGSRWARPARLPRPGAASRWRSAQGRSRSRPGRRNRSRPRSRWIPGWRDSGRPSQRAPG